MAREKSTCASCHCREWALDGGSIVLKWPSDPNGEASTVRARTQDFAIKAAECDGPHASSAFHVALLLSTSASLQHTLVALICF